MANIFSKIGRFFGLKSQKKTPPPPTFIEQPGQLIRRKTLEERVRGIGVGIPEERFATLRGALTARAGETAARAGEAVSAAASARGLGRSTIPVGQIGREQRLSRESLEERLANVRLQSEVLRQQGIQNALAGLGQLGGQAQAGSLGATQLAQTQLAQRQGLEQAGIGRSLALTASILGGTENTGAQVANILTGNAAEVKKSSGNMDMASILQILKLLGAGG